MCNIPGHRPINNIIQEVKNNKLQYVSFSALLKKDLTNPFSLQNQQINALNVEKKDTWPRSVKKKYHMILPGFKDNFAIPVDSMAI